jgi:hypothetical protein
MRNKPRPGCKSVSKQGYRGVPPPEGYVHVDDVDGKPLVDTDGADIIDKEK